MRTSILRLSCDIVYNSGIFPRSVSRKRRSTLLSRSRQAIRADKAGINPLTVGHMVTILLVLAALLILSELWLRIDADPSQVGAQIEARAPGAYTLVMICIAHLQILQDAPIPSINLLNCILTAPLKPLSFPPTSPHP